MFPRKFFPVTQDCRNSIISLCDSFHHVYAQIPNAITSKERFINAASARGLLLFYKTCFSNAIREISRDNQFSFDILRRIINNNTFSAYNDVISTVAAYWYHWNFSSRRCRAAFCKIRDGSLDLTVSPRSSRSRLKRRYRFMHPSFVLCDTL